ncbi:MAG: hypothetical protein AMS14_05565 [Planctomycetes bacterium DG_20]|nr:MAG: hypothetical protein AMS14_05565 [Planctomycetes bacterium DG_20]
MLLSRRTLGLFLCAAVGCTAQPSAAGAETSAGGALNELGIRKGVCAVLGLSKSGDARFVVDIAAGSELLVYFQSPDAGEVAAVRQAAEFAGPAGRRIFADRGGWSRLHLADNLAGGIWVSPSAKVPRDELLRVLHPEGRAVVGAEVIVKPLPEGIDSWSHPYHGPDNNPLSTDQLARAPYLTQFLSGPAFGCQPGVTVAAGGRAFKAFGHIAFKDYQNHAINTLFAVNGYNGEMLWKRPLRAGFMIHRNAMIATPDVLYLADDQSCKLIDARTGKLRSEIKVPAGAADGPVWKWMALGNEVLYALVGGAEFEAPVTRAPGRHCLEYTGVGGWPWASWPGYKYNYQTPGANWAFGRTILAFDAKSGKVLWKHSEQEYLDGRAVCMRTGRIYFHSPGKLLGCLDAGSGKIVWKSADPRLLQAIGMPGPAQRWLNGFSTSSYLKCNDDALFFAGPQRGQCNIVAVDAKTGKVQWSFGDGGRQGKRKDGNYHLVLREDALYAIGTPDRPNSSVKLSYKDGSVLARFLQRRACTRATGSIDSIFYRAHDGTARLDVRSGVVKHLAPMRPPCQDGVIISDGLLYWGPWICGCPLSLFGHVCLGPAGDFNFRTGADAARLEHGPRNGSAPTAFETRTGDWPAYRHDPERSAVGGVEVPDRVSLKWIFQSAGKAASSAPTAAGGHVFLGGKDGVVRALSAADGQTVWTYRAGAAVNFPPTIWKDRAYFGSNDGWVYCLAAADGRLLWRHRAAPAERWIPVYGTLASTWPVAGGVAVKDGVVYAAAGVADHDGTHVCALDAITGRLKWHSDSSGAVHPKTGSGISLQGNLRLVGRKLCFPGGNVHATAEYDVNTGRCLTGPARRAWFTGSRTLFYHSHFANWLSVVEFPGGEKVYSDGGPLRRGSGKVGRQEYPWSPLKMETMWTSSTVNPCRGVALGANKVLLAISPEVLAAVRMEDGRDAWVQKLPAPPTSWGLAVDGAQRVFVTLEDGRVLCFAP